MTAIAVVVVVSHFDIDDKFGPSNPIFRTPMGKGYETEGLLRQASADGEHGRPQDFVLLIIWAGYTLVCVINWKNVSASFIHWISSNFDLVCSFTFFPELSRRD